MKFKGIFIYLILLFLIVPVISAGTDLTDPYVILGKYFETIGGLEKVKAEKTSYSEATVEVAGLTGTLTQWTEIPVRERVEMDLKVFKQISGDNGQFAWMEDANGKVQIQKDEAMLKRREVKKLLSTYKQMDPNSDYFSLTYEGIEKVGDVDCYVVKTTNNINDDITFEYINISTFLMEKTIQKQPDNESHNILSDYREINGIKHPFKMDMEILPVGQKMTIQVNKFESNVEIDPSLFEPPADDVQDFKFTNGSNAENVPFQFIGNHIYLKVNINGKERLWCLDTGAGKTVIDLKFAAELGIKTEGELKGKGAGNTIDVSFATLPPFSIQGIQFNEQQIVSIDIQKFFKRFGLDVVGILGYDFLSRFVIKIDYAFEKLSFYHPDSFNYSGTGKVLDVPLSGNIFTCPAIVDGKYAGNWTLDLGAGGTSIHYPFAEKNNLLNLDGIERMGMGAGGEFKMLASQFQTIEFGDFTIEKPLIDIPVVMGKGAFSSEEHTGNLGNSLFRHFILYLDYKNQQMIIEKGKDFERKFPRDKSGLQFWISDNDEYEIRFVSQNTPAEKAGFKKGDIIKSINDIDVEYFDGYFAISELLKKEAGTKYAFKVQRGDKLKKIKLKLQDLY